MGKGRFRRSLDAFLVVACEAALFGFFWQSGGLLGSVPVPHVLAWLQNASPERALTALFRSLGLVASGWLLASTVAYALAVVMGWGRLLRGSRAVTLPCVRRAIDALAAASLAASSLSATAAAAFASHRSLAPLGTQHGTAAAARATRQQPEGADRATGLLGEGAGRREGATWARLGGPRPRPRLAATKGFDASRLEGPQATAVSETAIGRHFPHPGQLQHALPTRPDRPDSDALPSATAEVPSEANGFAGLPPGTKVVVVRPGDCLSVIAERYLGDWRLDKEIAELNYGRPQPDGRALVNDHWIYPGWVLVMPQDATGTLVVGGHIGANPGEAHPSGAAHHKASAGGGRGHPQATSPHRSARRKPAVALACPSSASRREPGPKGSKRARAVPRPGASLHRPGAAPPQRLPAQRAPFQREPVQHQHEPVQQAPAQVGPPGGEGLPGAPAQREPPSGGQKTRPLQHGPVGRGDEVGEVGLVGAGLGALATAGFVWWLDRARREQAHARPKGRVFRRNPPVVEAAERRARALADDEAMKWADLGLRYLSGLVEQLSYDLVTAVGPDSEKMGVPSLVAMRVGNCGLEVELAPAPKARLGWFSRKGGGAQDEALPGGDGATFVLDADISLDDLEALGNQRWPAWPAVVPLGEEDGNTYLFNLEHAGSLSVEGDADEVRAALSSMALQLATQPWSDAMLGGLYAIGPAGLAKAPPRLTTVASGAELDLAEELDRVSDANQVSAAGAPLSTPRAIACEALPNVVFAFAGAPSGAVRCLVEAAVPETSGVVTVAAGPLEGSHWRLALDGERRGRLVRALGEVEVHRDLTVKWDFEEVGLLSEALQAATTGDEVADNRGITTPVGGSGIMTGVAREDHRGEEEGRRADEPPTRGVHLAQVIDIRSLEAANEDGPADLGPGQVEICVLGPLDVLGGDLEAVEGSRRMATLALLAYLACHPRPVTADELATNLWPLDVSGEHLNGPQRKTVMNAISRARRVLGYGCNGRERIHYSPMGYTLSAEVTCDWARFKRLVTAASGAQTGTGMAKLRRSLELVRGAPFAGALSSQFFEWVQSEHLDLRVSGAVVDAAQDLAEMALEEDDLATVEWAANKGLLLEPAREELFRLLMHAYGRSGRPGKVDEVYRRLAVILRQRLDPLYEPQPESREVWHSYTSASSGLKRG